MSATADGRGAIDFARSFMPALAAATEVARRSGALAGRRVGVAVTLDPKTACLAEALADVGADAVVLGHHDSTSPEVATALSEGGVRVLTEPGAGEQRAAELRDAFIDTGIELLADDGARITRRLHSERRDALGSVRGVAEATTRGARRLRNMEADGVLAVACVAVADARTERRVGDVYGRGQSVVMAVLDATNMQMAGTRVVVAGYGRVGRGIAAVARGLGARVTVTEIDPVEALAAHHDGHDVAPLGDAVAGADFLVTASGVGHTVTATEVALLPDGAVLAVGGSGRHELDLATGPALVLGEEVRPRVRAITVPSGATVFLVADGQRADTGAGEGSPIEVIDLALARQLRALHHLATRRLPAGVHVLPPEIDDEIAASQLAAAGITIDTPTEVQRRAARSS